PASTSPGRPRSTTSGMWATAFGNTPTAASKPAPKAPSSLSKPSSNASAPGRRRRSRGERSRRRSVRQVPGRPARSSLRAQHGCHGRRQHGAGIVDRTGAPEGDVVVGTDEHDPAVVDLTQGCPHAGRVGVVTAWPDTGGHDRNTELFLRLSGALAPRLADGA